MPTGAIAAAGAYFGEGSGPILLSNVVCNGDETRIVDCPNQRLAQHSCFHSEDASVICQRKRTLKYPIGLDFKTVLRDRKSTLLSAYHDIIYMYRGVVDRFHLIMMGWAPK